MAAPAARDLVIVDAGLVGDGRGTTAPAVRGLVVVDIGRVGDGRGRGGTAAPAARDLVVVDAGVVRLLLVVFDIGRVGDGRGRVGMVAPATRDLVVVDAGVVRLLLEGLGLTSAPDGRDCLRAFDGCLSAPRLLARGSVRGVLPRSTARDPVRGLVVIDVSRVGDGRGRGGTAAPAARDLVVVDAGVVRLLLEGLGLTSAFDGRVCLRAVDGRLSAPRLLARGFVRGILPQSTARRPVRGLIVIEAGRVGDGRGRGGTAAPAARDLVVVDAGRVGDGRGTRRSRPRRRRRRRRPPPP
jgi:hypothetical protein